MKKILFVVAAVIISVTSLHAQKGKEKGTWNKLGQTTVDFKTAKAIVDATGADNIKALRIKTDAPVHIDNLIVVYTDGSPATIPIRYDFRPGIESRPIDLENAKRSIKEVDIDYKLVSNTKTDKATIEIWALK